MNGTGAGVSRLTVCGYKSIRELRDFPLTNLNVLIGANGAGKSNFISLFRLLNETMRGNLPPFVQKHGGPDAFLHFGRKVTTEMTVELAAGDAVVSFRFLPTVDDGLICVRSGDGAGLDACRVYHFNDAGETAKVKRRCAAADDAFLKPDAANLAAFLRRLRREHPGAHRKIVDVVRMAAPFFDDFVDRPGEPDLIELEWTQVGHDDTPLKAFMLSDGTLRFVCLAALLLQPAELAPATVLIDEPELGLHPYAVGLLADLLKQAAETKQLIVSTQSVELVNELAPEDVVVVDTEDGRSTFRRLDGDDLAHWLEDYALGELWKRNILGGRP